MRVFGSVVGPQTAIVFCHNADGSEGRRVRPKLIRHDPGWRETLLLEKLFHQLSGGQFGRMSQIVSVWRFRHQTIVLEIYKISEGIGLSCGIPEHGAVLTTRTADFAAALAARQ